MYNVWIALKMLMSMVIFTGFIYPFFILLISQTIMPKQAGGSFVYQGNKIIGSKLIAQNFKGQNYFWPRPSSIDFNPIKPSGGSNLGPTSQKLKEIVEVRERKLGVYPPSELIYSSGSGLDPHISLKTAYYQIERVAQARSIQDHHQLRSMIDSLAEGFNQKYVNVLWLNQTLDQQFPMQNNDRR